MKVLLVNGSPREAGCTYTALMEVAGALERSGVEWELFQVGAQPIRGCIGCGRCRQTGGKCVFSDRVNDLIERAQEADGFVFGTTLFRSRSLLCSTGRFMPIARRSAASRRALSLLAGARAPRRRWSN